LHFVRFPNLGHHRELHSIMSMTADAGSLPATIPGARSNVPALQDRKKVRL
jgi:hypothetical protein